MAAQASARVSTLRRREPGPSVLRTACPDISFATGARLRAIGLPGLFGRVRLKVDTRDGASERQLVHTPVVRGARIEARREAASGAELTITTQGSRAASRWMRSAHSGYAYAATEGLRGKVLAGS